MWFWADDCRLQVDQAERLIFLLQDDLHLTLSGASYVTLLDDVFSAHELPLRLSLTPFNTAWLSLLFGKGRLFATADVHKATLLEAAAKLRLEAARLGLELLKVALQLQCGGLVDGQRARSLEAKARLAAQGVKKSRPLPLKVKGYIGFTSVC
jgi:hypothetical protein